MDVETLTELCKRLEHFETPEWAARAILKKELLTVDVLDPCAGAGVLSKAANDAGYEVFSTDIHDWGFELDKVADFMDFEYGETGLENYSVFMNPPFSLATKFVEKSIELGARKIVSFQRFAWWESNKRKDFWRAHPPNRVYICGDRADCWRHDIPQEGRGSSSPTAHAWFVWEPAHPQGTILGHIYKGDAK